MLKTDENKIPGKDGKAGGVESTRDKIFNTAVDLFARKGFNGVSIREITGVVGIKESSLYNHFKSKEGILEEIFKSFLEEYAKLRITERELDNLIISVPPEVFLQGTFERFKERMETSQLEKIFRILIAEQFSNRKARDIVLRHLLESPIDFYEIVFSKMMKQGVIKSTDPRIIAAEFHYPIFAMVYEYSILKSDKKDTGELEARIQNHISYFCRNIRFGDRK